MKRRRFALTPPTSSGPTLTPREHSNGCCSCPHTIAHSSTHTHAHTRSYMQRTHAPTSVCMHKTHRHVMQSTPVDTWANLTSEGGGGVCGGVGLCPLPVTCSCPSAKSTHTRINTRKHTFPSSLPSCLPGAFKRFVTDVARC